MTVQINRTTKITPSLGESKPKARVTYEQLADLMLDRVISILTTTGPRALSGLRDRFCISTATP